MKLAGKVALVTGGSRGLGRAIVKAFLAEGANVVTCARNGTELHEAVRELNNPHLCGVTGDVVNLVDVFNIQRQTKRHFGYIDILVNNAGSLGAIGNVSDVALNDWDKAMRVNLYAPLATMSVFIPEMKGHGYGKIINLSGGGATKPMPGLSAYAASKAALVRLTETVALELKGTGIDVNAVAPGVLPTRMLDEQLAAGPDKIGQAYYDSLVKQKEGGLSFERATELCVFLASEESDGLTGKLISAQWDDLDWLKANKTDITDDEILVLRRIDEHE